MQPSVFSVCPQNSTPSAMWMLLPHSLGFDCSRSHNTMTVSLLFSPWLSLRPNAAPASPTPAKVDLISPMPSPAERATSRRVVEENEAPRMNLRRKRVLEAIFPKPVTRRKKLWSDDIFTLNKTTASTWESSRLGQNSWGASSSPFLHLNCSEK